MATKIELIVGLGNPGSEYAATRHNVGFWFVDLLAAEHGGRFSTNRKLKGDTAEISVAGHKLRLLKPSTYMNLSGESVTAAAHYFKIPIEHVLVAYDELDLTVGRVQLKFDGGAAGHNGVTSVIEHLGAAFWRLRFGVGHPRDLERTADDRKQVVDHLLKRAAASDETAIREALKEAAAILPVLLENGAERAKNRLHTKKETT
jgi:PTH1 family peptidyl-tRNA hydrolase